MQPCSQPRYGLIDWSNEISGDLLREMIERAGSTVVASGGNSSSRLPHPSSTASVRVDSNRPAGFDTAPRPVLAPGRVVSEPVGVLAMGRWYCIYTQYGSALRYSARAMLNTS